MILVTGANGFIGSYVCKALYSQKKEFIALIRPESNLDLLSEIKESINFHHGDVLDIPSLEEIFPKVTVVIHCAAIVSYNKKDRNLMSEVNVEGTQNMVNMALNHNIDYFIHVSSVAALGRNTSGGTIDETNKWQESKWNTNYGESKYYAELEVWRGITEGMSGAIVNPSVVLGPGNWEKSSCRLFNYVYKEKPYYPGGVINYVDVRDVTKVILTLLEKKIIGERYIVNAGNISFKEFFEKIGDKLQKRPPHIKASPFAIKVARILQGIKSAFSNDAPMITRESAMVGESKIYFDNSKIKNELNHTFVSLADTIQWTCENLISEKNS